MKTIPIDRQDLTGKTVLLSADYYGGDENQRLFRCLDGFGCRPFCMGQGVFGTFVSDGEEARVERFEIEAIVVEELGTKFTPEVDRWLGHPEVSIGEWGAIVAEDGLRDRIMAVGLLGGHADVEAKLRSAGDLEAADFVRDVSLRCKLDPPIHDWREGPSAEALRLGKERHAEHERRRRAAKTEG